MSGWIQTPGAAIATVDFVGDDERQMTFKAGDHFVISETYDSWFRGFSPSQPHSIRLIPRSYVNFTPQSHPPPPPTPTSPPPPPSTTTTRSPPPFKTTPCVDVNTENKEVDDPFAPNAPTVALAGSSMTPKPIPPPTPLAAKPPPLVDIPKPALPVLPPPTPSSVVKPVSPSTSSVVTEKKTNTAAAANDQFDPKVHYDCRDQADGFVSLQGLDQQPLDTDNASLIELYDAFKLADAVTATDALFDVSATPQSALEQLKLSQHQSLTAIEETTQTPMGYQSNLNLSRIGNVASSTMATSHLSSVSMPPTSSDNLVPPKKYHLYLNIKACIFSAGEDTELMFSIYSNTKGKYITEDYVVNLPPPGQAGHTHMLDRMKTVFKDLDPQDVHKGDLWLIGRIFRIGGLIYDPKNIDKASTTRRPFGCTAICLSDIPDLYNKFGVEYPPVSNSYLLTIYNPTVETHFPTVQDSMIRMIREKDNKELVQVPLSKGIAFGLTLFEGNTVDKARAKRVIAHDVCETPIRGFSTFTNPLTLRNDLYIQLHDGSFSQDKKSSARNIEVRVKLVRNSDYTDIPNSMCRGAGEESRTVYASGVYYHTNTPLLQESFKVKVPTHILTECHLVFEFWHVSTTSKKSAVFSTAYFPLTNEHGSVIANHEHTITTYKPWGKNDQYLTDASKNIPRKETFKFSTMLVSSVLSQNPTLTAITKWRLLSNAQLTTALQQFLGKAVSDTTELAHLMKEVLNVFAGILGSTQHAELHNLAYQCLVHALARLSHEHRLSLELYCTKVVSEPTAFAKLLSLSLMTLQGHVANAQQLLGASDKQTTSTATSTKNMPRKSLLCDPGTPVSTGVSASGSYSMTPSSPTTKGNFTFSRLPTFNEDEDECSDSTSITQFCRALPFLVLICTTTYGQQEKNSNTQTPASFRAPPPVLGAPVSPPLSPSASGSIPTITIPLDLSRPEFKAHILSVFALMSQLLALDAEAERQRTVIQAQALLLQSYASLLCVLTENNTISPASAVFSADDVIQQVQHTLTNIGSSVMLAVEKLHVVKTLVTGVIGALPPSDVSLKASKNVGLNATITSWANSWTYAPQELKNRGLSNAQLDQLLPTLLTLLTETLNSSVRRSSMSESYIIAIILQHLYSRIHAHTHKSNDYSKAYVNPEDVCNTTFSDLVSVVPALVNITHLLLVCHPSVPLPRHEMQDVPNLSLPISRVTGLSFVDPLTDYVVLLLAIMDVVPKDTLAAYFASLPHEVLATTLQKLFFVLGHLVNLSLFPSTWLAINMFQLTTVVSLLFSLASALKTHFSGDQFTALVWVYWLQLALEVKQTPLLNTDAMGLNRSTYVKKRYGDVRKGVFELFYDMWESLQDGQKVQTAFILVEKLLNVASNKDMAAFKSTSFDLYFDLLCSQYRVAGDFAEVERYSIDALYEITNVSAEQGSMCMTNLYESIERKFKASADAKMTSAGIEFLDHMRTLFQLMSSLLQFPDDPKYEDERTSVALRLINYIERTGHSASTRKAMHARYVQYLADLHAAANNHVEAGITQLQQVKMLDWAETSLDAFDIHPTEPERLRKERLIKSAITSFYKAEDWERCIELVDYLRYYYQHLVFDYASLAQIISTQAQYFSKIVSTERFYSNYFRVVFYGQFEDETMTENGGEFVYKGVRFESVMEFTGRVKRRYPDAHFFMSADKPSAEMLAKHKQVIAIGILSIPSADQRQDIIDESKVAAGLSVADNRFYLAHQATPSHAPLVALPPHVAKYLDSDNIRVFEYSRPWRRTDEKNPANEFKDLWLVRTYIIVAEAFPSNRRRIPVVERFEVIVKPVATAIEAVHKKTKELLSNMATVSQAPPGPVDVGPLSMNLNGMIDAAVNGGTNKYLEAFLTPGFVDPASVIHDDERAHIEATIAERHMHQSELKAALREQFSVLQSGLNLFGSRCDEKLNGLYEHLCAFYATMITKTADILAE